ncbi:MAG: translation initiation factor IF-3 [Bdellovibrionales bacterium]|nr:translation initiation factor IF-3 [Bdellovibrionales bacterium]
MRPDSRDGQRPKKKDDGLRINYQIRAPQVRVIDEEGKMVGVMAPNEAVRIAEERGLDLIEIAPTASPPTCKIGDYGKYKYEQKKKAHEARKNQVVIEVKELQLRPRTDQHDLEVKMKHARRFLEDGDKVKMNLRFRGREMAHAEFGHKLLTRAIDMVRDIAIIEAAPKMEGKMLFALLAPDHAKIKEIDKTKREALPEMKDEPDDEDDDE